MSEDRAAIEAKIQALATEIEEARYVIVHTGADISTSAGIISRQGGDLDAGENRHVLAGVREMLESSRADLGAHGVGWVDASGSSSIHCQPEH